MTDTVEYRERVRLHLGTVLRETGDEWACYGTPKGRYLMRAGSGLLRFEARKRARPRAAAERWAALPGPVRVSCCKELLRWHNQWGDVLWGQSKLIVQVLAEAARPGKRTTKKGKR